jgi:hypothetical protein
MFHWGVNNKHHLLITNLLGEIITPEMVNGNEITLDVSSLTAGVYFAVIKLKKKYW